MARSSLKNVLGLTPAGEVWNAPMIAARAGFGKRPPPAAAAPLRPRASEKGRAALTAIGRFKLQCRRDWAHATDSEDFMPRISVIIPTHNRPSLLPRAVESARRAGSDVEIVVVDDASTDETAEVCASLEGIRYVRLERNQGVAGARNVGVLASTADFVAFLDDDDLRLPGSLDLQLKTLLDDPAVGFVCGPVLCADQGGGLTG